MNLSGLRIIIYCERGFSKDFCLFQLFMNNFRTRRQYLNSLHFPLTLDKHCRLSSGNILCLSCLMSLICCVCTYFPVKFNGLLIVFVCTESRCIVRTRYYIRLFVLLSFPSYIWNYSCLREMCIDIGAT